MVMQAMASWGRSQTPLSRTLQGRAHVVSRIGHKRRARRASCDLVEAAFAKEMGAGPIVCCGDLAYLLPGRIGGILRVRLIASLEWRIADAQQCLGFSRAKAERYIRRADRDQETWIQDIRLFGGARPPSYDLVLNLTTMDAEAACNAIVALAERKPAPESLPHYASIMEDIALTAQVRARLALDPTTCRLKTQVETESGSATIRARSGSKRELAAIRASVSELPGARRFELVAEPPVVPSAGHGRWRIGLAFASLLLVCMISIGFIMKFRPGEKTFVGIVTDTRCAASHRNLSGLALRQCVQSCVGSATQVKYALYDGRNVYTLSDQKMPEAFTAQRVKLTGVLDRATRVLHVRSIQRIS